MPPRIPPFDALRRAFAAAARFGRDRGGNVALTYALLALPLFGAAGFMVDYTRAASVRTSLQASLDAAVLAGMKAAPGQRAAAARQTFLALTPNSAATITLLTVDEPRSGERLVASAQATVASHFAALFGQDGTTVGVQATARFSVDAFGPDARPRACILLLDPSAPQALQMRSGADIVGRRCEVHVRSSAAQAAAFEGDVRLMAARICIAGPGYLELGTNRLGPVETGCNAARDPFANAIPAPASLACDHTDRDFTAAGPSLAISPGVYCGATRFAPGQAVSLAAGLYVLRSGPFVLPAGASLAGTDVSFHFADRAAKFDLSGAVRLTLSAPRAGGRRDVLMDEPGGLAPSHFEITTAAPHALAGLIRLPSRNATLRGAAAIDPARLTLVVNRLVVAGSTQMRLETSPRRIEVEDGNGVGPAISLSR